MQFDENYFQKRLETLSDVEILKIVTSEKSNYEPSAIKMAENEIKRRGLADNTSIPSDDIGVDVKDKYLTIFKKFDEKGFVFTWSWGGFFFPYIWYLNKGMRIKSLLITALAVVFWGLAGGLLLPLLCLYGGLFGKWDYYLSQVRNKQAW